MILVRNRCAEQRHDAVANDFVDRALVAMHGIHHHADCPIEDAACFFRIVAFEDLERAFDVGKQHRDVLALARHQRPGIKDASCQGDPACRSRVTPRRRRLPLWRRRVELRDSGEQLLAVTQGRDAEVLEIVSCQRTEDLRVDVVRREHFSILAEVVSLQPGADVHSFSQCTDCEAGP